MNLPKLCLVVPCFNEEKVIKYTISRLENILDELIECGKISKTSYICLVDDGSTDETWNIIKGASLSNQQITGLKLSRNFGHQAALFSGLLHSKDRADCVISIDADLQQDEKAIPKFLEKYLKGCDIVFGVRINRQSDSFLKKITAVGFYKLMQLMGVKLILNHADYRLVSNRVLHVLSKHKESNLFLRGIFPSIGFKTGIIYHEVRDRFAGESKYTIKKMLSFALNGITSFSIVPIRFISAMGLVIFIISFIMSFYVLLAKIFGQAVAGWASTVLPIYFIGGIQLLSLGLLGEYIAKIYVETKRRPLYIIEEELCHQKE